jgi:hypothetical protein
MTLHLTPESALALAMALHDPGYAVEAKRKAAADAIEDLIAFLDDTEGDCDLEENGDERDSSWPAVGPHAFGMALDEGAEEDDAGEDSDPAEPMLGAPERHPSAPAFGFIRDYPRYEAYPYPVGNQTSWADGHNTEARDDCEEVNEDGGDVLDAPHDGFLGWPEDVTMTMDTSTWFLTDAELDDCDCEDDDPAGGDILDEPHDDEGDREYDLCFNFGLGSVTGEFDGPRDCDWKSVRDRPAATLFAAQAKRMAVARSSRPSYDPEEVTIIAPGIALVGRIAS